MNGGFNEFLRASIARVNSSLAQLLEAPATPGLQLQGLFEAESYATSNGGKRVRALLVYAAARAVGVDEANAKFDHPACAIELIHAYSLTHDDLPAMDDDDLRRGKPSLHRAYDEATAILVGDGLQARAFQLLAATPDTGAEQKLAMISLLAQAAGSTGMVGGQYIDIAASGNDLQLDELRAMHGLKTGALIRAALGMGAMCAGANEQQLRGLDAYGTHIGLAFQVVDDILDVAADTATLGKTSGKDADANKPTYVKLLGLEGASAEAQRLLQAALEALAEFGNSADHLRELAHYIVERKY